MHKIFFVDGNNKKASSDTMVDWQQAEPDDWDEVEEDLSF